ncbi:cysteine desulfurase [Candidatus Falkowbacteria bacterium]|uniref:cysteine desulfurase n=1 Tax=Candidatus Buchananbacteria bacterium CG10_big_fil_rev_8_21_14_0_10_33_19 TaxID=1974525 RepID=A0A2H0W4B0_9BACT|nr:cysteine desulfurase [Candidatus Falkowbacteria bacterium]PIS06186.1 MAG: cysteine desulfurase NifS [Candidatus Buchananbacteria bacterium CG10_big_fil_rev_8_21_14_0_10_33_19]
MIQRIYLDNAATTKMDPMVLDAMLPYMQEEYGNASSLHYAGLDNRVVVDRSQAKLANFLGCSKSEVYFTSGATESDNMAIFGVVEAIKSSNKDVDSKLHVITTKIEHDAILEPCHELEKQGVEVTYLLPDKNGMIDVATLKEAIRPETVLVSIMYINNEIGTILPITQFGELISELNKTRETKIYFHTDATQAINFVNCNVADLKVDLLSMSGHKIYGPKGVGAIYIRQNTPFKPLVFGGHQQANIRPGTYNVPGIVGLTAAIDLLGNESKRSQINQSLIELRDCIINRVLTTIDGAILTGGMEERSPNNASFVFDGAEGEDIVLMLSERGIALSTGSACSAGSLDPSHVLLAIGVPSELAHSSLRVSLSKYNTQEEIDIFLTELITAVTKLRSL